MALFGYTYTTLKAAIQNFTEDSSAELLAVIDDLIGLAEIRLYKEADLDVFRKYATSTIADGDRFISKPLDFVVDRFMYISVSSSAQFLEPKEVSFLTEYWPNPTLEDVPLFYADWDHNTFALAPTPNANYTVTLGYTYRPARLDSSTATTWLSSNAPDALLYAALVEAATFIQDLNRGQEPGMLDIWEAKYQRALATLRFEEMKRQRRTEMVTGEGTV